MCGKGIMYGNKVSHAKNRSKRTFKPNLHAKKLKVGTRTMRVKLCSSCVKLLKRAEKPTEKTPQDIATA
jgi:large subunit ribosomal protein L28